MTSQLLEKLTIRNVLAVTFTGIFGWVVYNVTTTTQTTTEDNTIIMLILGALITNIGTIIIFYFRKAQSKESKV